MKNDLHSKGAIFANTLAIPDTMAESLNIARLLKGEGRGQEQI